MCIIVAKEAGVKMPSDNILANCFEANPDGAGYMIADGKTVSINKGFMSFESFMDAIESEGDLTSFSVVMHFRIATHGDVQPSCCHPFPVTRNHDILSATRSNSRVAVAHNGTIGGMKTSKNTSDTMAYIASVIAPMRSISEDFIHNDNALDIFEATVGSKLCFLDNSGDIVTIGDFIEDDGVLYSNASYVNHWSRYSTYGGSVWGGAYDDYYSKYRLSEGGREAFGFGYEDTEEYMDYVDDLVSQLPWSPCVDCELCFDCALDFPICSSERDALSAIGCESDDQTKLVA